jgi:nucleotide-binding universal stress UspA family protein
MPKPTQALPDGLVGSAGSRKGTADDHERDLEPEGGRRATRRGTRVLVATDLSDAADLALREGAALAASPDDSLAVVHARPAEPFFDTWLPQRAEVDAKIAARASEAVRERTRRVVGDRAEVFVDDDVDYAAIIKRAEAWRADVIVLGSHGRSGLVRSFGGVVERVLRHAPCSVLVVRPSAARGWVLAATDLSTPSLPAITSAGAEARRRGAQLEVVHAVGFFDVEASYLIELGTPSVTPPPLVLEVAGRELSDCVARLHVRARCVVLERPAAAAIVKQAESIGAELVVVGARGRTGLSLLPLGSVAEKVVRTAPCSVLVARAMADW